MEKDIETIRNEIDAVDNELLRLIQKRCELSLEMGRIKHRDNLNTFDPSREASIIERLFSAVRPPVTKVLVERLFTEIFSFSRSLQEKKKIAYLGPEGSYSHQAAHMVFGQDSDLLPQKDIETVITEVMTRQAELGVVPVENSSEGMINRTLDMMADSRLFVCQEIMLPIRNCLLSAEAMENIRKVYSHPQALAQCRNWLMNNLPGVQTVESPSTSLAALAASREGHSAAIASSLAAELYGLTVLAENINDRQENITRFWVIAREPAPIVGKAKTSIIVTLENVPAPSMMLSAFLHAKRSTSPR
ncbi:MAG TPA: prephenate dehydratase domain-containing protein [Deltaproteobacteria bacterium]|nr:prephenate dehydratase domain-containing protein [Deltaproteobacteria bacterium]